MRKLAEAVSCRCQNGTLVREYHLTNDGHLWDNPDWECGSCKRIVPETNPTRVAPWADGRGPTD